MSCLASSQNSSHRRTCWPGSAVKVALTPPRPADYDHCCFKDPNQALTFTTRDDMGYLYFSSTTHRKIRSVQPVLVLQNMGSPNISVRLQVVGLLLPCSLRLHIVACCLG